MNLPISSEDRKKIQSGINEKYARVATSPAGQFNYPTGREGLEKLGYPATLIAKLPHAVANFYCGVGNPFALGAIHPAERVLDIGCGAGIDTILAGQMVGRQGSVVGIDIVPGMIERAERNLGSMDLGNVVFQIASGETLPFNDQSFDVVISNGAINLIPDKDAALKEMVRVLKPAGRLMVADQVAAGDLGKDLKTRLANWFQ